MKRWLALLLFLALASCLTTVSEAADKKKTIPRGASIFITPMAEGLDGFIRAEMLQKNVPLKIVLKLEEAHLILTGSGSTNDKRSWHEGWLTMEKDHSTGSAMIIDRTTKQIIWAGEAGDRSLLWGSFARAGPRKVASRLVNDINDAINSSRAELPVPPPLSDEERAALNPDLLT
jgi:hypothetical protein